MKRRSILIILLVLLPASLILLSACGNPAPPEVEATVESGDEVLEAVASRTPEPTSTPGPVDIAVENFTENMGIENISFLGLSSADWINLVISIGLAFFLYKMGMWFIRSFLRRVVASTPTELDDKVLDAMAYKIRWLIIVFAIQFFLLRLQFLNLEVRTTIQDITFVSYLLIIAAISWDLVNPIIEYIEGGLSERMDANQVATLMQIAGMGLKSLLVIVYLSILLDHFGISIVAISAVLGIGGLALSLAAQDTIADFISGIIILVDQPFRVGDRIEVDTIKTWGDVTEVGLRTTKIRTRDNRLVMIPNSTIGNSSVVNYTFPDPRYRIQIEVGIGYGQDIDEIRRVIVEAIENIEGVIKEKPVDALFVEFGDTNIVFRIRWWIDSYVDTRHMFDRVNQILFTALEGAGIDMPFTTYDVNIKFDAENSEKIAEAIEA